RRDVRHLQAVAVNIELPAVIDAAHAARLVAAEEQRGAAVRATLVHHADAARGLIAERDQLFTEQQQLERLAAGLELARFGRRDPVLAHQLTHHGAGSDTG